MTPLYERYRPREWGEVIRQDKVLAKIAFLRDHGGLAGRAYFISGQSVTGKTTIARLIAAELADEFLIEEVDSETLTPAQIQEWEYTSHLMGYGKGGRVYIVNEAHGLKSASLRQLLVTLERIPKHVAWIFTTTREGQEGLFDKEDAHPMLSRCVELRLTTQGLCNPFAQRVQAIATSEGMNGQPIEAYYKLAKRCSNNMRMMIQEVESGAMMGVQS